MSVASRKGKFSDSQQKELNNLGVDINIFSISSSGLNFFEDCKTIYRIYKIIHHKKNNKGL